MLTAWVEYAQYTHPVDEVLLQRLEQAEQPVPATAAFLQDDLAVIVVEGLLNQIKLMKKQHVSVLEQIERVGKRKAPVFEELMVEPKRARAPSQHPQELAWAPACTIAQLPLQPLKLASGASTSRLQEQRSKVPQAPVASSSKAGASSQGGAQVVPELPVLHVQLAAAESHRLSVSVPAPDVLGPLKHC
ncbi:hypothetical protein C0995_009809 [Termitomyces sp. Mi166|nr:hypothetical protein C0995_009809 [Termitomyces sp. Mi166\